MKKLFSTLVKLLLETEYNQEVESKTKTPRNEITVCKRKL